jgi:hypothetical protein
MAFVFKLTPEMAGRIDEALSRTNGNRSHAGDMLGITTGNIDYAISVTPGLRARWGKPLTEPETDTLASEIDRPSPPEIVQQEEAKVVKALDKQDDIVAKSNGALPGFTKKDSRFFGSLIAAYAQDLKTTLDFSYAGSVHANARLVLVLEQMCDRLADIGKNPQNYSRVTIGRDGVSNETKGPSEYVKETVDMIVKISAELRKLSTSVAQAQELRLKVEKLRAASKGTKTVASWDPSVPLPAAPEAGGAS